jgi:hypothetical protein
MTILYQTASLRKTMVKDTNEKMKKWNYCHIEAE